MLINQNNNSSSRSPVTNESLVLHKPASSEGKKTTQKSDQERKKKLFENLKEKQKELFLMPEKETRKGEIPGQLFAHQITISRPNKQDERTRKKIAAVNKNFPKKDGAKRKTLASAGLFPTNHLSPGHIKKSNPNELGVGKKQLPEFLRARKKNMYHAEAFEEKKIDISHPRNKTDVPTKKNAKEQIKHQFSQLKAKWNNWKEKRHASINKSKEKTSVSKIQRESLPGAKKEEVIQRLGNLSMEQKQERMKFLVRMFREKLCNSDEPIEGVFRVTGNQAKYLGLASSLCASSYQESFSDVSIPDLASSFKIFVNSCRIFSDEMVVQELAGFSPAHFTQKEDAALRLVLEKMTEGKKQLLRDLLSLLKFISTEKKDQTQMGPSNLAICIGPNFVPESGHVNPIELLQYTRTYTGITERLISLYNQEEILNS